MSPLLAHAAVFSCGGLVAISALCYGTAAQLCYGWRGAPRQIFTSLLFGVLGAGCIAAGLRF